MRTAYENYMDELVLRVSHQFDGVDIADVARITAIILANSMVDLTAVERETQLSTVINIIREHLDRLDDMANLQ